MFVTDVEGHKLLLLGWYHVVVAQCLVARLYLASLPLAMCEPSKRQFRIRPALGRDLVEILT